MAGKWRVKVNYSKAMSEDENGLDAGKPWCYSLLLG